MGDSIMSGLTFSTDALAATPTTGATEYNGTALYFTPTGTQRGVIPGQQFYMLQAPYVSNGTITTAQGLFGTGASGNGVGVTLSSSTIYGFEFVYALNKTASTTSHTVGYGFGGTATINNIGYLRGYQWSSSGFANPPQTSSSDSVLYGFVQTTSSTTFTGESTTTTSIEWMVYGKGTVSVNAGGTFIPQFTQSAATGPYTINTGSYFLIYPIGAAGANVSIGAWS